MTREPPRTVVAFDFDGTITRHDTMLPFLGRTLGWGQMSAALMAQSVGITLAVIGVRSRDAAKERLLRRLLAGRPVGPLEQAAESFADYLLADRLRRDTLDRIRSHRAAGHELVVVSAAPDLWVSPLAARLGFTATLATRLEIGPDGRLTGGLLGLNCRGAEKVRRLQEWVGDETPIAAAYGDSSGDREMIAFAGEGGLRLNREWVRRRG